MGAIQLFLVQALVFFLLRCEAASIERNGLQQCGESFYDPQQVVNPPRAVNLGL